MLKQPTRQGDQQISKLLNKQLPKQTLQHPAPCRMDDYVTNTHLFQGFNSSHVPDLMFLKSLEQHELLMDVNQFIVTGTSRSHSRNQYEWLGLCGRGQWLYVGGVIPMWEELALLQELFSSIALLGETVGRDLHRSPSSLRQLFSCLGRALEPGCLTPPRRLHTGQRVFPPLLGAACDLVFTLPCESRLTVFFFFFSEKLFHGETSLLL